MFLWLDVRHQYFFEKNQRKPSIYIIIEKVSPIQLLRDSAFDDWWFLIFWQSVHMSDIEKQNGLSPEQEWTRRSSQSILLHEQLYFFSNREFRIFDKGAGP